MTGWRDRLALLRVSYADAVSANCADSPSTRPNGTNGTIGNGVNPPVTPPCLPSGIDLGKLPTAPCSTCGGGSWWRISTVEPDGPGPWCCHQCQRPDPVVWIDATATEPSRPPATEEPDEPLWPDPGTPERERLDRKNAAICAGLLAGYHRHRAALAAKKSLVGGYRRAEAPGCWPGSSTIGGD